MFRFMFSVIQTRGYKKNMEISAEKMQKKNQKTKTKTLKKCCFFRLYGLFEILLRVAGLQSVIWTIGYMDKFGVRKKTRFFFGYMDFFGRVSGIFFENR